MRTAALLTLFGIVMIGVTLMSGSVASALALMG
jgi:hypothetical protein